jgi:hypothetical protein
MSDVGKIRVRLYGGLGNQIFQFYAGLNASYEFGADLEFDTRWLNTYGSHLNSSILNFNFMQNMSLVTVENSQKVNFTYQRIRNKVAQNSTLFSKAFCLNVPKNCGYIDIPMYKKGIELRGYYQSYEYYKNCVLFGAKTNWSQKFDSFYFKQLKNNYDKKQFISIHVRGGDYLNKPRIYQQLGSNYYKNSVRELRRTLGNLNVYVFSDDESYARYVLRNIKGVNYVDQNELSASEAMLLMSMGQGLIIANSTFSYWSAIINGSSYVIAPKFWFTNRAVSKYLYSPAWQIF